MSKATFYIKEALFTSRFDLSFKKKLECHVWTTASYGTENWTLQKADQKYLESSETWCCRRMGAFCWNN
jgi:hypothetical protein